MNQDDLFADSESDRWFERNRAAIEKLHLDDDVPIRVIDWYRLSPKHVLEIGAANGYRVAEIVRRTGARGTVIEPSAMAIADGKRRFPGLEFLQGGARELRTEASYDLVIVNFVLHWVDRTSLLRVVSEIDRVTADGGFLLIGDFHPSAPTKVRYHHRKDADVYTYKQDYGAVFAASGLYQPVCFLSGDGHAIATEVADRQRAGTTLLRKTLSGAYALG